MARVAASLALPGVCVAPGLLVMTARTAVEWETATYAAIVASAVDATPAVTSAAGRGWLHAYVPRVPHDDAVLAALRARTGDAAYHQAQAWGESVGSSHAIQFALKG
jgi:hypothetical protein